MKGRLTNLIRTRLPKGQFARGVALLAGGNALGQALLLVAAPILTRLYSPEDFGLLALYMSITGILQVLLSMRYEYAINLAENVREALAVLKLCLIIVLLFAVLSLVCVLMFSDTIAVWLGAPRLADYLWMIPISLLLIGSFNAFKQWCVREGEFSLIGRARLKQVVASLVVQIGGFAFGPISLLGGQVANQVFGVSSLGKRPLRIPEFKSVNFAEMRKMLVRYRRFPLYSTWSAVFSSFSRQLPTFFFVILFGPAVAGFYAITNRVLKAPSLVFIGAINSVFFKNAASAHREGNLRQLTLTTYKNSALMTLPLLLLLGIISPPLFTFVFGEQWAVAGEFARWLTILVFFQFVCVPLTPLFSIREKQSSELVFETVLMISRALALIIGARIGDSVTAVILFSIGSGVCYIGFLFWVGVQIGSGFRPILTHSLNALSVALVVTAPIIFAIVLQLSSSLQMGAAVCSAILCGLHLLRLAKQIK